MRTEIKSIQAREILDSRGNPTIEADVILQGGEVGRASVPSGASTGSREALEKRDQVRERYFGKGVQEAVRFINEDLAKCLHGQDVLQQKDIDQAMIQLDGTENKARFGANAILAVSMAAADAAALSQKLCLYEYLGMMVKRNFSLPVPMMNIINGGAHADNNLDFQEFMILPIGFTSFSECLRAGVEVFHSLKALLKQHQYNTNVGDEGGFAPNLKNTKEAIELILQAIHQAGYKEGQDIYLGFDIASNELYRDGQYHLQSENLSMDANVFKDYLLALCDAYPIISIEDAMAENDWQGWQALTQALGGKVQLVGDDLFVTNTNILERGIHEQAANAILIKLNQIGTLTETMAAVAMAKNAQWNTIISHRSGETEDAKIADLAVGLNAQQIKTGSLCRTDRVGKYNQLLRIEEHLGKAAIYAGQTPFEKFSNFKSDALANGTNG